MTKEKKERQEAWMRIIVFIISGIILWAWGYLILLLTIFNFISTIFSGKRNKGIAEFCGLWNTQVYGFLEYITFFRNERPFPFNKIEKNLSGFR
jgi:hypothetical protein